MNEARQRLRPSTLLGFDYGERRIGVAVGQQLTATATPVGAITVSDGRPDWEAIETLIAEWQAQALVVGLPLSMDDSEQPASNGARRFATALKRRFALPIYLHDERLSTREARERLQSLGEDPEQDDAMAAQIILEGWLSHHE